MLDKNLCTDVLTAALSTGGDFAELFVENAARDAVSMVNGVVEKALWGVDYGCGIRIFNGYGAIYAYTNDTSRENLLKIAKEAAGALKNEKITHPMDFSVFHYENIHQIQKMPDTASKKMIVDRLREVAESSSSYHELITQTINSYGSIVQDVLIANSDGLWAEDRRVRTRVIMEAVASSATEKQTGSYLPGASMGFEFFESLDMKQLGTDCAEIAIRMLNADLCPSGKMPVIIGNGFGGVIFHEACGHGLEATSVAKKASVFADKLGETIASPLVTAIDDGTLANHWGSCNIDDEGGKTQRNVLIENGVLKTYLVDRLNGLKMGMPSTGSSRRESYKYAPTSRMTNTFIAAGHDSLEEIISSTENGLYAKKMGGGSVQPATGEFNFAVLEGYLIKNGKITVPVRGATLIGKGSEVLLNIDKVSGDLKQDQGMCGSISGAVPTNVGQPTIRVRELTVGGRK